MSKALTGNIITAATRAKISKSNKGRIVTAATRAKISKANVGRVKTPAQCAAISKRMTGTIQTAEHRAKTSKFMMGNTYRAGHVTSTETRAKLSKFFKGRPCVANNGHTRNQGVKHPLAKLTEKKVREIHRRAWKGDYQAFIAECFGISACYVSSIKHGKCWRHLNLNKETI